jgi:ATP-dependent Clp protease ATP-binding subunit ClpA
MAMNINLPIYVEGTRPGGGAIVYHARPLFFRHPVVRGEKLDRLTARLARDLAKHLHELGRQGRHDELAAWTFSPTLHTQRLDLTLALRRGTARCRFLFVLFRQFDRRIAFTPSLPEVWFDLERNQSLAGRAAEVFTRHFRDLERDEDDAIHPEQYGLKGTSYVTSLEISVRPPAVPPAQPRPQLLMLGDQAPADGAAELRRVGRCLDWQYPDDLDRVVLRDAELAEVERLLGSEERRPLLLVGPRQVGKTALLHEYVWRTVSRRRSAFLDRGNVWLLAPSRLISGMSYVGQWENRLLAILKEARRRRHVLYFDDLLGLFHSGQTCQSSLSVADVLKPYLERRQVQVVAEITPEALRVLRERDRGFADLFHPLPVRPMADEETLRVLIHVQRQLEARHSCCFELDVLPTIVDLQRRYVRDAAFPGKGAALLHQLAVKFQNKRDEPVSRAAALAEFHLRSGLAVTFLDRQARLARNEVLESLGGQVIGQDAALHAAANAVTVAKARLNDPDRPLGVFLFLGPTGVGKTECAKAVARYLFGSADRLLRFDLNEYGEVGASARLVGTFAQPEGLLTSGLRRQPFAIVLFDEVEKAHPEVFDLLLQVLGEGRLTDALGRTADFSNALIVLTSNLGVREAEAAFGFRQDDTARDAVFVRAAERFFRPEFVNRIDRIVPFGRLSRDHMRAVARKLIEDVFAREGLVQRKCLLSVEAPALERVVDQGYDPLLGARALKRSIERALVQPVAERLAVLPPGAFTAVRVYPGPQTLAVDVRALEQVQPVANRDVDLTDVEGLLRRVRAAVRRIEDQFGAWRPSGPVTLGQVAPEHYRYFALREQAEQVRGRCQELAERADSGRHNVRGYLARHRPDTPRRGPRILQLAYGAAGPFRGAFLREIASALDINEYLRELVDAAQAAVGELAAELQEVLGRAALLHLLADSLRKEHPERVVLWPVAFDGRPRAGVRRMLDSYVAALPRLGLEVVVQAHKQDVPARDSAETSPESRVGRGGDDSPGAFVVAQGPHALPLLRLEEGVHLFIPAHGPVEPLQVVVLPVPNSTEAEAVLTEWCIRRRSWLDAVTRGEAAVADDPLKQGPVVRITSERTGMIDLRTGLAGETDPAACLLAALPLPAEIFAAEEA